MTIPFDVSALMALLPKEELKLILADGFRTALLTEPEAAKYLRMDKNAFRALNLPVTRMHGKQQRVWSRATLDRAIAERTPR